MSALVQTQERVHSSNPIEIFLSNTPRSEIERMVKKFRDEGLHLDLQGRAGEVYEFLCPASDRNHHKGQVYRVRVGRDRKDRPVTGWCSCTYPGLCKHLAQAYVEAKELQDFNLKVCGCGAEFVVRKTMDSDLCFFCLTEPRDPWTEPAPKRGAGCDNTCHWCHGQKAESLVYWIARDGVSRYYAHTSCEIKERARWQHA